MFFIGDLTEYARTPGARDKQKRRLRNTLIGAGVVGGALLGAGLLARKARISTTASSTASSAANTVKKKADSMVSPPIVTPPTKLTSKQKFQQRQQALETKLKQNGTIGQQEHRLAMLDEYRLGKNAPNNKFGQHIMNNSKRGRKEVKANIVGLMGRSSTNPTRNQKTFERAMNDPNYTYRFSSGLTLATFKRGKDKHKRVRRMGRFGAKVRIGTVAGLGSLTGAGVGMLVGRSHGAMALGALGGGTAGGLMSYYEHKKSPYSPIGKKKWRNYVGGRGRWYGISTDRLDAIGEP